MHESDRELTRFEHGGLRWVAETWLAQPLRDTVCPHLGELESHGATRVKRSLARTVYRIDLAGRTVFIKHHRVRSPKETLKYLVLPSRAAAEWNRSRAMAERGIPAPRAVALGERRVAGVFREAVLVSEAIDGAVPLSQALRLRPELLGRAARLIRQVHEADVHHRDLHGGNIVVAGDALVLIDLHRVRVARSVPERERIDALAQFLAALGDLREGDRLAFIRAYLGPDAADAPVRRFARAVEKRVVRHRERRYASRTKRCVKKSTGFRRDRVRGISIRRRTDFPAELVLEALDRHAAATDRGGDRVLKCEERTKVTVVEMDDDRCPRLLCVKEFARAKRLQRLGDLFVGSPAHRAWLGSNACAVRGIPTPRAFATARAGSRSFLVTEYVDGARPFNLYVADHGRPRDREATATWRAFIRQAADFVRLLHSHRLRHRDLSGKNILVREGDRGPDFYLIDVGDIRTGAGPSLRFRIRNLGQLDDVHVQPSRTDRLRFYRHYARGRPELDGRPFLAQIDAISRARHERWLRHGGEHVLEERRRQGKPA